MIIAILICQLVVMIAMTGLIAAVLYRQKIYNDNTQQCFETRLKVLSDIKESSNNIWLYYKRFQDDLTKASKATNATNNTKTTKATKTTASKATTSETK